MKSIYHKPHEHIGRLREVCRGTGRVQEHIDVKLLFLTVEKNTQVLGIAGHLQRRLQDFAWHSFFMVHRQNDVYKVDLLTLTYNSERSF